VKSDADIERDLIVKIEKRLNLNFGAEWRQWATSLYSLTDTNSVTSSARDWKEAKTWQFTKRSDALLQVEKLIRYKVYDRCRGRGDAEQDLAQVQVSE
jgi:hypothetical protein